MRVALQYKPDKIHIIFNEAVKNLLSWCMCFLVFVTPRRWHLGAETCSRFLRLIYELYLISYCGDARWRSR